MSTMLHQLLHLQRDFSAEAIQQTSAVLKALRSNLPKKEKDLIQLHHALLFSMAYPGSRLVWDEARQLMQVLVKQVSKAAVKDSNAFYNSGITGSMVCARFGLYLNQYLLTQNLSHISLNDVNGDTSDLVTRLSASLDAVEQELMPGDAGYFSQWSKAYVPAKYNLEYYIQAAIQAGNSIAERESIFANMELYTQFRLDPKLQGLSEGRLPVSDIFLHAQGIQKKISIAEVLQQGAPKQVMLNTAQKQNVVNLARGAMASLLRETDTFSYAQIAETELFNMGKGIDIALYYMVPEQKFSLQSYVGYLLYKNGLPMAYGGCWIVGSQAAFGMNVLPPYRGGESTRVIGELLRLYRHRFNVSGFSVDPYQIGQNNEDGIQSGAFWFYYKLGFRPMQASLAKLAKAEAARMQKNASYRSDVETLTRLADSELYLAIADVQYISLTHWNKKLSSFIVKEYHGNRKAAQEDCMRLLKEKCGINIGSKNFVSRLSVFLVCAGALQLKQEELQQLIAAYNLKSTQEAISHAQQQACKGWWSLLEV